MKRYDLRHLKDDFYDRMVTLINDGIKVDEVGIFMFEVGDFSSIQKSADVIKETGHDLMNSLKFNEVDWTVVVKKVSEETRVKRAQAAIVAKKEAEEKAAADAIEAEKKAAEKAKKLAEKEAAKAAEEAQEQANEVDADVAAEPVALKSEEKKTEEVKKTEVKSSDSKGDDLTKVLGIGEVYQGKLHDEGIFTYEDIVKMTQTQIDTMEEKYTFKGDFKDSIEDAKNFVNTKAK
jgi:NADH-quinone oxidoreductase subunit E